MTISGAHQAHRRRYLVSKAPLIILGLVFALISADIYLQSTECLGTYVSLDVRTQSISDRTGTRGSAGVEVGVIRYSAGGQYRTLDGPPKKPGDRVVVWYYSRVPKIAWVGLRGNGSLIAGFFAIVYWVVLMTVIIRRFK